MTSFRLREQVDQIITFFRELKGYYYIPYIIK